MDPFSIVLGAGQIASGCVQVSVQIVKFVGELKTVDARVRGFYDEVIALQATYEGLAKSLEAPAMVEAARVANKTQDGAHLWGQVRIALDDSRRTVNRINQVLNDISKKSGFARKVRTLLDENLKDGELYRLRQRIQFFNATISLPIQMMGLMLQLEQRDMNAEHQRSLMTKFVSLEQSMRQLITSDRVSMYSGSTLLVGTADEYADSKGKETYLSFAKKILSSASAAASTRSSLSSITPRNEPAPLIELGGSTTQPYPDRRRTIPDWIPAPDTSSNDLLGDINRTASMSSVPPDMPKAPSQATEVAYKLAQQHLKLGQEKAEKSDHESAERSFRKSLQLLEKHDFSGRIAFQPAEVVLMLAQSCLMQQKYDEAIVLLSPVAERQINVFPMSAAAVSPSFQSTTPRPPQLPDKLQALAASHMLGEVYMQKGDYESAKDHSLTAFMERTDELGEHDEKTLESVKLIIDVYRAMGDEEEAEAYGVFLTPAPMRKQTSHVPSSREPREVVFNTEGQTAPPSISPPPSDFVPSPVQTRKPSRPSFTTRLKNIGRPSQTTLAQPTSDPDSHRRSFSRTTTLDNTAAEDRLLLSPGSHPFSTPSETSHERSNSYADDDSMARRSSRLERSTSMKVIEPTFLAVEQLCQSGDFGKAVKTALRFLKGYESNQYIVRRDELEKNIRKGVGVGLASTGEGYSPLHYFCALRDECSDEVALLLKYGADPSASCFKAAFTSANATANMTPLGLAISRGHTQIAQLLLETKDIRTDMKDADGFVPLLAAARRRQHSVVEALLNHAPQSIPKEYPSNWYGCSPLHDAAKQCDLTLVELYLQYRYLDPDMFNVNLQDKFGKTALMHAITKADISNPADKIRMTRERRAVIEALLEAGADTQMLDDKGHRARYYAEKEQGSDVDGICELVGITRYELG